MAMQDITSKELKALSRNNNIVNKLKGSLRELSKYLQIANQLGANLPNKNDTYFATAVKLAGFLSTILAQIPTEESTFAEEFFKSQAVYFTICQKLP